MATANTSTAPRSLIRQSAYNVARNRTKSGFVNSDVSDYMLRKHNVVPGPMAVSGVLRSMHKDGNLTKQGQRKCLRPSAHGRKVTVWKYQKRA